MVKYKIPEEIPYAWGYVVPVKIVPRDQINGENGDYDPDTDTIQIADDLSLPEKRWVYLHEKRHADADYEVWVSHRMAVKAPQGVERDDDEGAE